MDGSIKSGISQAEFINRLAQQIRQYWRDQGVHVETWVENVVLQKPKTRDPEDKTRPWAEPVIRSRGIPVTHVPRKLPCPFPNREAELYQTVVGR